MAIHLILLAAGQGTRMASERPKVLHEVGGLPLFAHALRAGRALGSGRRVIVVGHGGEAVADAARSHDAQIAVATQDDRLGTAHAVAQARPAIQGAAGDALVLYGDTPFLTAETLARMAKARAAGHDVVVLGFRPDDPGRYGRLVMDGDALVRIVEWKDATEAERAISLCNSGVLAADASQLFELVAAVRNDNAAGEYYLTDIVAIARGRGLSATAIECDPAETLGVNSRADLARAEAAFQNRARARALDGGATLIAPETVFFAHDTRLGRDVTVEPHVVFGPGVTVEDGATIRAFSHLEGARIGPRATIGPHARLRPGAEIGHGARIGNFVEVKAAAVGANARVGHLTYLGDADIGNDVNIGAGTITCNYDGVSKHRSEIGANAFIGSDTMLVAPVRVGRGAFTATGSVITEDVPDDALAVARVRQTNKPGFAARLRDRLRAAKQVAAKAKG